LTVKDSNLVSDKKYSFGSTFQDDWDLSLDVDIDQIGNILKVKIYLGAVGSR